jgi:hypothetical protein
MHGVRGQCVEAHPMQSCIPTAASSTRISSKQVCAELNRGLVAEFATRDFHSHPMRTPTIELMALRVWQSIRKLANYTTVNANLL